MRDGLAAPICAMARVTAYSAAARAVVYFTPISVTAPSDAVLAMLADDGPVGQFEPAALHSRGHDAALHERHVIACQLQVRKRLGDLAEKGVELVWRHQCASAPHGCGPCHVPIDSFPCQGSANSRRPSAVGAPQATAGAGRRVTRFSALTSSGVGPHAHRAHQPSGRGAGGVDDDA